MDKKGIIVIALAFTVMITWPFVDAKFFPPKPLPPGAAQNAASPTPAVTGTATPGNGNAATTTPAANNPPPAPAVQETEAPVQTQKITAASTEFTFTNHGGGIATAQLLNHAADRGGKIGVILNDFGTIPVGAISDLAGENADNAYNAGPAAPGVVTYERTTARQIDISKKFTLPAATGSKDEYVTTLEVTFTNKGDKPYRSQGWYVYLGSAAPVHEHDQPRYIAYDWYRAGTSNQESVLWFNAGKIPLLGIQTSAEKTEYTAEGGNIGWAGVSSQYFTTIIAPLDAKGERAWASRTPLDIKTHEMGPVWAKTHPGATPSWFAINGALGMPGYTLDPGKSMTQKFRVYLGPKQYQILRQFDGGESQIMHLGWFGFVSKFLLRLMNWLHAHLGVSYAWAIIILTITLKLLLWPMQNRATQSMKKMQALSPKMTELRDKYKDDPAKMNQETLKLYKTYGVNPMAGCLPMFIQLPVFIGFYTMLGAAIELRNSDFFWVHDLSQPDTIAYLLGIPINVLPLCMAGTSIWMMAVTPKSGDAAQQRMMMFMPLIFLFICYTYASGLALYMMVSNLFSVAQLYLTRNQALPTLEKLSAAAAKKKR